MSRKAILTIAVVGALISIVILALSLRHFSTRSMITKVSSAQGWLYEGPIYEAHPYYFDGTFKGITQKIPEIADLGVKTIYLMPIWKQPPGFPEEREAHIRGVYNVYDYRIIDPLYGTKQELKELIDIAHRYDIKILFDLVVNNTREGSAIWNLGGVHKISLRELREFANQAGITLEYRTVNGKNYVLYGCVERESNLLCQIAGQIIGEEISLFHFPRQGWGFAIDYTNPALIEYLTDVAEYYVNEYDIDGWRIDAPGNNWNPHIISGDHSAVELLKVITGSITEIKPNAILLPETAHVDRVAKPDPVLDEMCDASYSHHLYIKLIQEGITDNRSQGLIAALEEEKIWYDRARIRFLEIHDTGRINRIAPELNKPFLVLIATIPGIPMIQAGQEIGATIQYGPDLNVNWDNPDKGLREYYKKVFQIRSQHPSFKYGSIENIFKSGDDIFAYSRSYQKEDVFVAVNSQGNKARSILNLQVRPNSILYDELSGEKFTVEDPNNFQISLPPYGSIILVKFFAKK